MIASSTWRDAGETREGLLADVVPIDQVDARHLHRDFDADVARDQVQREVEPRRAATRHDEALALAGNHQRALRVHAALAG